MNLEYKNIHIFSILLLGFMLGTMPLHAREIEVDFDMKVIHTDSLSLPNNTSALTLLTMLPEMLQRPGDTYFSNYEVKVDGMSVSQVSDIALSQLMIDDIETIEVDESPLDSYNKNGVGGSINLVLRKHGPKTDRIWGSASLNAGYPLAIAPQLNLAHRQGKLFIRGLVLSDIYHHNYSRLGADFDAQGECSASTRTDSRFRYYAELARMYMLYNPTDRDELKFNISQSYSFNRTENTTNYQSTKGYSRGIDHNLHALFKYSHNFGPASLAAEMQYQYRPGNREKDVPDLQLFRHNYQSHNISGKVEVKAMLIPSQYRTRLNISTGCNLNGVLKSGDKHSELYAVQNYNIDRDERHTTFFAQPYLKLELSSGKFRMKAEAEYQHFRYMMHLESDENFMVSNDFTGKLMAEWHFTPHQNLRLIADRKLERPSEDQLYPEMNYDLEGVQYIKGNPDLLPVLSHEVRLDYLSDYQWGEHLLTFNASVGYIHVKDIIETVQQGGASGSGGLGYSLAHITWQNGGINHVANANLMALYRYRIFTLSLTGNVYHKDMPDQGRDSHYTYYNLALSPQFNLHNGWGGGCRIAYYSHVRQQNGTLDNCATASLNIGHRWKGLYVYVYNLVAMQGHATDRTNLADGGYSITEYDMVPTQVGLGINYSF